MPEVCLPSPHPTCWSLQGFQPIPWSGFLQGSSLRPSRRAQSSNSACPKICSSLGWMPCPQSHLTRLEHGDDNLITVTPHRLSAQGLSRTPGKQSYYVLMAVSVGSSPEMQRRVAVGPGDPVRWGPARNFPGKAERQGGQLGLLVGHAWRASHVGHVFREREGPQAGGSQCLEGKTVWPPAKLDSQSGPTEAHEQIALCDQSPRAPTHLCYSVQGTEGCLAEVWTREKPSFLDSRGRVPQAPAHVWACRGLSPGWG